MKLMHWTLWLSVAAGASAQGPASRPAAEPPPAAGQGLTPRQMLAAYEKASGAERERLFLALVPVARQVETELGAMLSSKDAALRLAALKVLQQAVIKAPAAELTALTRDENDSVRETAVIYIAACRPSGWTATLVRVASNDRSQSIRRQAIVGLGDSGDLSVVPELTGLLAFVPDDYLARKVATALQSLTGETKGLDQAAWEKWWAETGRERLRAQEAARAERALQEARSATPK